MGVESIREVLGAGVSFEDVGDESEELFVVIFTSPIVYEEKWVLSQTDDRRHQIIIPAQKFPLAFDDTIHLQPITEVEDVFFLRSAVNEKRAET